MPRQLNVPDDVNDPTACPSSRTRGKVRDRTRETTCIRVVTTNMTDSVTATREILVAAWAPVPGVVSTGSSERSSADRARYIRRSWPHCDIWLGCCHSEDFMALLTSCRTEVIVVVEEYIGACRLSRLGSSDGIPRKEQQHYWTNLGRRGSCVAVEQWTHSFRLDCPRQPEKNATLLLWRP
jgi:hypothetical protein